MQDIDEECGCLETLVFLFKFFCGKTSYLWKNLFFVGELEKFGRRRHQMERILSVEKIGGSEAVQGWKVTCENG